MDEQRVGRCSRRPPRCWSPSGPAVCTVAYLGSGALFVGILAVRALVELYNWRAGTTYLRR